MNRLNLTAREQLRLRREIAETLDARIRRRTLAVAEFEKGRPVAEIAHVLGMARQSVYRWIEVDRQSRDPAFTTNPVADGLVRWTKMRNACSNPCWPPRRRISSILRPTGRRLCSGTRWRSPPGTAIPKIHFGGYCSDWIMCGSGRATTCFPIRTKRKKRRIRWQIRALPQRSMVSSQEKTDLLMFPPLRSA